MRILRIIARLNMGGPARHVVLLDRGLRDRGHDTLLVHGTIDEGEASFEALAAELDVPTRKLPELGRRVSPLSDARAFVRLTRLMFDLSPDVVHTHTAKAGALGRAAALVYNATRGRRRRCLVVHTYHGHVFEGYFSPLTSRLVCATERWLARISDRIVTISPAQRDDIVNRFHIAPADRTVVVPLGLDLTALLGDDAPSLRPELGIGDRATVFGYVGRMVPIKNLGWLLEAFAAALPEIPEAFLLMVGDGSERATLERRAVDLGLSDRVRWLGWRRDLARVYATVDVGVLSSRNEGTPVALIETMAAGRPVVAVAVGGVPDVVGDGETGWLVPPGATDAFAAAMVRLARSPTARRRMGEAGRAAVRDRFAPSRLIDDVDTLYTSDLAEKRGAAVTGVLQS